MKKIISVISIILLMFVTICGCNSTPEVIEKGKVKIDGCTIELPDEYSRSYAIVNGLPGNTINFSVHVINNSNSPKSLGELADINASAHKDGNDIKITLFGSDYEEIAAGSDGYYEFEGSCEFIANKLHISISKDSKFITDVSLTDY